MKRIHFFLFIFLYSVAHLAAELKLPAIFSHGMVLQQDMKVPIWGWGEPNVDVKVSFSGRTARGETDDKGFFCVKLGTLKANSTPQKMTIEVGEDKAKIIDVLIGEVWLLSGQSNMDWTLTKLSNNAKDPKFQPIVDLIKSEVAEQTDNLLRQITVPHKTSYNKALMNFEGKWIDSKPENNGDFSGTGYFFAKELRKELEFPLV